MDLERFKATVWRGRVFRRTKFSARSRLLDGVKHQIIPYKEMKNTALHLLGVLIIGICRLLECNAFYQTLLILSGLLLNAGIDDVGSKVFCFRPDKEQIPDNSK